ncbi:8196_t:CDS:2 [Cetraspora pellucida]|uniref:8196_t:CDS:1 n=1 Tax=Cetraspora pellucida TaxID=1433469 RepID=A0A9N9J4V6_9GLOM|nr:8196_t:CDS:2 [Cetraspora pellucida]
MYNHKQEISNSDSEFSEDELEVYFLQNHHNKHLIDGFPVNPKYLAQETVDTVRIGGKAEDDHADQELIMMIDLVNKLQLRIVTSLMLFYGFFSIESLRQIVESTNKYSAIQNSKDSKEFHTHLVWELIQASVSQIPNTRNSQYSITNPPVSNINIAYVSKNFELPTC